MSEVEHALIATVTIPFWGDEEVARDLLRSLNREVKLQFGGRSSAVVAEVQATERLTTEPLVSVGVARSVLAMEGIDRVAEITERLKWRVVDAVEEDAADVAVTPPDHDGPVDVMLDEDEIAKALQLAKEWAEFQTWREGHHGNPG